MLLLTPKCIGHTGLTSVAFWASNMDFATQSSTLLQLTSSTAAYWIVGFCLSYGLIQFFRGVRIVAANFPKPVTKTVMLLE